MTIFNLKPNTMNNLKLKFKSALLLAFILPFTWSCDDSEVVVDDKTPIITDDVKTKFSSLGFDVSDLSTTNNKELLNPAEEANKFLLEGDLVVSMAELEKMLAGEYVEGQPIEEQYRTNNLVSQGRTINVIGYTGNNSNGLDSKMRTALSWAIDNYNAININLNFTLTYGTNYSPYDIVVYRVSGAGGGSAGFPSGGAPNKYIQIQSGTSNYDTNVVEHVITHEIGHSVGLRHTDYFNRSISCGSGGNEGDGGVGAIHVPGTPTNADMNSIMLACFGSGEDGEFGSYDVTALNYLY